MGDLISTLTGTGGGSPAAVLGAVGLGSASGLFNVMEQRKWNERAEANTWDMYQTERADAATSHQRAVKDLKAAGLNPILAAGKGSGSPVASGTASQPTSPQLQLPDIMQIFSTAKQLQQRDTELDLQGKRLELDGINTAVERAYKGVLTKNERYGIQGMMADFFRELKNEKGEHLNLNDIMNFINKTTKSGPALFNKP